MIVRDFHWEAPHSVEGSPAGVACNPRDARVNGVKTTIRRDRSRGGYLHHQLPHRRPASPQTGGRGCGHTLVEAGQEWSRSRREGEGTVQHLRWCWSHHNHRPPLALIQERIADIKSINKYTGCPRKKCVLEIFSSASA